MNSEEVAYEAILINQIRPKYSVQFKEEGDNKPIGIILCTDKDTIAAKYALGGLSTNIFTSKYTYYIPAKEQLIAEVEKVVKLLREKSDNIERNTID